MQTIQDFQAVKITTGAIELEGNLVVPPKATGLVMFSHGSGSSRFSPRNNFVAQVLQEKGFATLLFDLLTPGEDEIYDNRFDIGLLTHRLIDATRWAQSFPETAKLPIGYFGASTGAASALRAAADLGDAIKAVVSRGGRPDLALPVLGEVKVPTLLIVGGLDTLVIRLNKAAYERLSGIRKLEIIPGATHLFPEPGKLEIVAALSAEWFRRYLRG